MYSDFTVIKLNAIAHKYKDLIYRSVKAVLDQPKYKNTGAGVASLHVDVVDGTSDKAPEIIISFDDHLLYLDKRKMQWTKLPDIAELIKWAETKTGTQAAAKKLAWAVAWDKRKKDTWRGKPWRKKGLGPVLKEMNALVLEEYSNVIDHDMAEAVK